MSDKKPVTTATVKLGTPIARDGGEIEQVTLRKPKAGELRGLNLQDILQSDVGALIKLVPRISDPALIDSEVEDLEADDLAEIGGTIFGFFMTPAQRAAISQLTG